MLSRTSKLLLVVALGAGSLAIAAPAANAIPTKTVKAASGDRWNRGLTHLYRQGGKAIVKWTNPTNRAGGHNVKSVNEGARWFLKRTHLRNNSKNFAKKTFKRPGRYWFVCSIHAAKVEGKWTGMVAKVQVH